jgi:cell division protein FtsL
LSQEELGTSIILEEIDQINSGNVKVKENGCVACHILFTLATKMQKNEQEVSELLSEILSKNQRLNDLFIEIVENIHMKQRMMGIPFVIKNREAKDRYVDSNFRTYLEELRDDLINYNTDIILRKLLLSSISLQLAQNIGIDYHAATEELYYYLRKNEYNTNQDIMRLIDRFNAKNRKRNTET